MENSVKERGNWKKKIRWGKIGETEREMEEETGEYVKRTGKWRKR